MTPPTAQTVLIGMGNPLMRDEGIGPRVLEALNERNLVPPGVEVADLGTAGFQVLHVIAGRRKAVFIDCARMSETPGTMRRFTPDEVKSQKVLTRLSLHEGDLLHTLELSRQLGERPEEVVIFGVEPDEIAPGQELSAALAARLDEYVEAVTAELKIAPPA